MAYYSLNIFWPQQITALYTKDNVKVGLMASTVGTALAMGEILVGPFFKIIGHARWQLVISSGGIMLFLGLMALSDQYRQGYAIGGSCHEYYILRSIAYLYP